VPRALACVVFATLLLVAAPTARAFDTGPHHDMTIDAVESEGFGRSAADIVALGNYFPDLYTNDKENPFSGHAEWYVSLLGGGLGDSEDWDTALVEGADRLHFDHPKELMKNTLELEAEWTRLQRGTTRALAEARQQFVAGTPRQRGEAILKVHLALGASLHELQDFYTHTNWLEPGGVSGAEGPDWEGKGQGRTPTWFDVQKGLRDGERIYAANSTGHRAHGGWNGDRNRNLSTTMNKDWPGRPLFTEAYQAAYFASRQWVRALRAWLGNEELWVAAQRHLERSTSLTRDVDLGAFKMSLYAGHWQGQGEPCNPKEVKNRGHCGDRYGYGGSLIDLSRVTERYFESRKTRFRTLAEGAIRHVGGVGPQGETFPLGSSRDVQLGTRFVRLQVRSMRGIELGDPGPDDADMYARASIAGQHYHSAIIHGHDRFTFGKPYYPFTWLKAVPRGGGVYGEPVSTLLVEVTTAKTRDAGTDDDILLRLGPGLSFVLDKRLYDDFERGDRDTYSVPIDAATRRGLSVGDIRYVELTKRAVVNGNDWRVAGLKLTVNGRVVYRNTRVNQWINRKQRVWRAPNFAPSAPAGPALPYWLDLREDDRTYGRPDQGDINRYDARDAVTDGYVPGDIVNGKVTGGEKYRGRLGRDGDDAAVTFRIDTLDIASPPPPEPSPPPQQPPPQDPPDQPPPQRPDLVISALTLNNFTVRNQGPGAAGPFTVTVAGFGTFDFSGLAAGESATRTYSSGCNGTSEARADSLNQVEESDESNNVRFSEGFFC
jgi:hypothetical protein